METAIALKEFHIEVDAETARLIRVGYSPWQAADQANVNVRRKRQRDESDRKNAPDNNAWMFANKRG